MKNRSIDIQQARAMLRWLVLRRTLDRLTLFSFTDFNEIPVWVFHVTAIFKFMAFGFREKYGALTFHSL